MSLSLCLVNIKSSGSRSGDSVRRALQFFDCRWPASVLHVLYPGKHNCGNRLHRVKVRLREDLGYFQPTHFWLNCLVLFPFREFVAPFRSQTSEELSILKLQGALKIWKLALPSPNEPPEVRRVSLGAVHRGNVLKLQDVAWIWLPTKCQLKFSARSRVAFQVFIEVRGNNRSVTSIPQFFPVGVGRRRLNVVLGRFYRGIQVRHCVVNC